jgi:hypothetical protein
MNIRQKRQEQIDWRSSQALTPEEESRRFEQEERNRALNLYDIQIESAKLANDPQRTIEQYKQMLAANRDNELALMNQRAANDASSQDKMYERMGALAREQAQSWLSTNKALADQAYSFRSSESRQQYEQDKDMQMSSIRENEGVETRRRDSERNSALTAFKRL